MLLILCLIIEALFFNFVFVESQGPAVVIVYGQLFFTFARC